jgi:hypothetical protein
VNQAADTPETARRIAASLNLAEIFGALMLEMV